MGHVITFIIAKIGTVSSNKKEETDLPILYMNDIRYPMFDKDDEDKTDDKTDRQSG